jgi:hypothetical protein
VRSKSQPSSRTSSSSSELDHARRIASDNGVDLEQLEVRALEPVTTVTLIVMGSSLAVATVVYLLDKHKDGQVIDLRPGAPKAFYRSKDVVYGLVLIIATDGKVTVEVKEPLRPSSTTPEGGLHRHLINGAHPLPFRQSGLPLSGMDFYA